MVSPTSFTVKALDNTVMPAKDRASKVAFQRKVSTFQGKIQASQRMLSEAENKTEAYNQFLNRCIDCHKVVCPGPIKRIKKLVIH